jgi:Predicted membrane protein (DUF2079)
MSDVAVVATTAGDRPVDPPRSFRLLHRVRWWGYLLLGLQLAGFLTWSAILYSRFSVGFDFAVYYQPWFLIAHGDLNPYSTAMGVRFWQNDSEFLPWALAPLYWVTRTGLTLSWLQDISIAAAEAIAFTWMCELTRRTGRERDAALFAGLGLLLLVANPWIWWSISFDAHEEALTIVFAALLARDLGRGRRRAWFWIIPLLAGGAPTATYVVGLGLGGVLAGRQSRRMGASMALLGIGYSLFVVLIHGDVMFSLPAKYGYLAATGGSTTGPATLSGLVTGAITHPLRALDALWAKRADMVANLAPGGLIGLGAPIVAPLMIVVLVANTLLPGVLFAEPIFQSLPIYVLLPVGTVAVLCWLVRRHRRAALALAGLVAAQAVGWAAVWGPVTPGQWLRVPTAAAATLASVDSRIPASAEVIASQGVLGRFSSRARAYSVSGPGPIPVHGTTWFVILPNEGIETASPATSMALVGELAGPLNATLIAHASGAWVFRWKPPPGVQEIIVPDGSTPLPAWTSAGAAGLAMVSGPVSGWRVTATGAKGYVADGIKWQEPPGGYRATVALSAAGPVNVEVWDDTSDTLVARRTIPATDGIQQVTMPVDAPDAPNATVFSGWGPFRALFQSPPAGQVLEVRVWSPGGFAVSVYNADLTTASGSALAAQP